jgi:phthalate 4,5-dioxygenase oxygenase subunit
MIARTRRRLLRAARALAKDGTVPPCVDNPGIYTQVRSGDFVADTKIAWPDAYEMQMRAAVRPPQQAAE